MGKMNVPEGGHKNVTLGALVHSPELYRAYPALRDMRVKIRASSVSDGVIRHILLAGR